MRPLSARRSTPLVAVIAAALVVAPHLPLGGPDALAQTTGDGAPHEAVLGTARVSGLAPATRVEIPRSDGGGAPPPAGAAFVETFTGNTGLERFDIGVWHRDDFMIAERSWAGDHDPSCGPPTTSRTITRSNWRSSFYLCRDHLMTSVGDTSGYSIAYFRPKATFIRGEQTTVSWDVNVTDLGARQWWEVLIQPAGATRHDAPKASSDGTACDGACTTIDWLAGTLDVAPYGPDDIVVGTGPFGDDGHIYSAGEDDNPFGYASVSDEDPEGGDSKAIRRTFTITDNLDGTITVDFGGSDHTYPGRFPERFEVVFKDHSYTPDKDRIPVGYTWHWDNIAVW